MNLAYCIVDKMGNDPSCGFFAVFDGHGGRQVAEHCSDRFPDLIRKIIAAGHNDLVQPITEVFAKVSLTA